MYTDQGAQASSGKRKRMQKLHTYIRTYIRTLLHTGQGAQASSSKRRRSSMHEEAAQVLTKSAKENGTSCRVEIVVHAIKATSEDSFEIKMSKRLADVETVETKLTEVRVRSY